mmetsp:Transcript_4155/g.6265  ORF Transcript_4155/g.6265 Transcript_4155/m.6265 type:complete len:109 (-) Transcript_4155:43-369(-)
MKTNILESLPEDHSKEHIDYLMKCGQCRIERIVSYGHANPEGFWYDQEENEWVMVMKGEACLRFDDGEDVILRTGDYLNIPSHVRHRVEWTTAGEETIWLAVFYRNEK